MGLLRRATTNCFSVCWSLPVSLSGCMLHRPAKFCGLMPGLHSFSSSLLLFWVILCYPAFRTRLVKLLNITCCAVYGLHCAFLFGCIAPYFSHRFGSCDLRDVPEQRTLPGQQSPFLSGLQRPFVFRTGHGLREHDRPGRLLRCCRRCRGLRWYGRALWVVDFGTLVKNAAA